MKFIRLIVFCLFLTPMASFAATGSDFVAAAQLLAAAKNGDIQQVQALVNNGVDVNYTDKTGLSIVCTALMNKDVRAAQILQMYGADASVCDKQIRQYKNKTVKPDSGGLFSGLSSAQSIALAAAGAAVVVGGAILLTKVFDPDNGNGGSSSGNRGEGDTPGGGGGGTESGTALFSVPYGPKYVDNGKINKDNYDKIYQEELISFGGTSSIPLYASNFNYFRPGVGESTSFVDDGIDQKLFRIQNYLLMMHGYSPLADGYNGRLVFRNDAMIPQITTADGGKPVSVGVVTNNGINPVGSAGRGDGFLYSPALAADPLRVDKYLNFNGPEIADVPGIESGIISLGTERSGFDLSGSGTAMNPWATVLDNSLVKIVAGWEAGGDISASVGDFYGFVPNAQVAVYRTGGGKVFQDSEDTPPRATLSEGTSVQKGAKITLNDGNTYILSVPAVDEQYLVGGTEYTIAKGGNVLVGKCKGCGTNGKDVFIALYKGTDKFYYVNTSGGDNVDEVWVLDGTEFYTKKTLKSDADIKTFTALYDAKDKVDVLANLTLNPDSMRIDYTNMKSIVPLVEIGDKAVYQALINKYYSPVVEGDVDSGTEGKIANTMFEYYPARGPIIVMPAGGYAYGISEGQTTETLTATFENYAPALFGTTLNHKFMTVVAVQHDNNTIQNIDTIAAYGNGTSYGKLQLSEWNTDADTLYRSRMCGVAGVGGGNVDPWCFAAAGATPEMASASAAGAVAAVKAAFGGVKDFNDDVAFTLLALTADGAYLGTDDRKKDKLTRFTEESLTGYLQEMYTLPSDIQKSVDNGQQTYLSAFKEVFGYGLINLERATTPGKSIYFFDGTKIRSDKGNGYWRAASNTAFNLSAPFGARGATISAPFYDVVTSVDGELSMPRIWENEFTIGADSAHALYMGDVLGDLKTRGDEKTQIGEKTTLSLARSMRAYNDNMGGLDNLGIEYSGEHFNMNADYQRYLTDGVSRFNGMANPILGLASNAITTGGEYKYGNFAFGGRAFSGVISDESLLQNDPMISSRYEPMRLGFARGGQANVAWQNNKFMLSGAFGVLNETNTLLGAQTSGLLDMGNGNTTYVDVTARYDANDDVAFTLRSTFARTYANPSGNFVLGISELDSNAFAFGADIGNFNLTVSQPLTISSGSLQYAYAQYDVVESGTGHYDLVVSDTGIRDLSLVPDKREVRFTGTYRHQFGEFTDGAFGFIYRINPNNTDAFGNESIFMLKMTHRLGI